MPWSPARCCRLMLMNALRNVILFRRILLKATISHIQHAIFPLLSSPSALSWPVALLACVASPTQARTLHTA